jgi:gliding motility-associated-like protein
MKMQQLRNTTIITVLMLFVCGNLFAQRERDNWYFASNAAINFPAGASPVEVDNASKITGSPSVSISVSDSKTGQLLFYSDGITVWDKSNSIMDNGASIFAPNVCDYVIYSPNPANKSQYFVFSYTGKRISYAVIDISLNGGLGKVVSYNNVVAQFATRKFTIAKHGTYDAYWLITLRGSNGNDTFECYPITTAGIQSPIRSIMGFNNGDFSYQSELITNGAGNKIIATNYSSAKPEVTVYDFSKNCGTVSTPKKLTIPSGFIYPKAPVFSKNDNNLFVSFSGVINYVVQYSGTDFQNFQFIHLSNNIKKDMKLGPDGKIYIIKATPDIHELDVIDDPDAATPTYTVSGGLTLKNTPIALFPSFINDVSTPGSQQKPPIIDVVNTCYKDTVIFTPSDLPLLDSLDWNFGDAASQKNTSKLDIPSHIYSDTGNFKVTLSWYNCGVKSSATKQVQIITIPNINLGADTTLCYNDSITLSTNLKNLSLAWSNGSTDTFLTITKAGIYSLTASAGPRCKGTDSIVIGYYPKLEVDFFDSTYILCEDADETVVLRADTGYKAYLWQPDSLATASIVAKKAAWYTVTVTNNKGCTAKDSVLVNSLCDNNFYVPNAFTPNNDGRNDIFLPTYNDIFNYRLEIYTRWGEKVFETTNPTIGWDGTHKGYACEDGAYIWRLTYQGLKYKIVRTYTQKGVVNLLR